MNFNYLNHKKFDKLPNEIETISNRNVKKDSGLKETNREKDGTTSVNEVNNIAEYINSVAEKPITENSEETKLYAPTSNAANDVSNTSNDEPYNPNTNIVDFIKETLQNAGIDVSDEQMIQIIAKVIEESIQGNLIELNIKNVTDLIDLNLESEQLADMKLITKLIDSLLQGNPHGRSSIMCSEVRAFILEAANEIIAQQPATPDPVEPDTPNIPTVATTPEEAMEILQAKLANATPDENMTVEEFLLQFENEATQYLTLQYGYEKSFATLVTKYLANAIDFNITSNSSCIYKNADPKDKFIEFIQDMSFLEPHAWGLWSECSTSGYSGIIYNDYLTPAANADGYTLHGNNNIGYYTGKLSPGTFFKFMTNYFRDEVYGGSLNDMQLELLYKRVSYEYNGLTTLTNLKYNKNYDTNSNGQYMDDIWTAMMRVADKYPSLPVENIESIDLDSLFNGTTSILTQTLILNKNNFLLCDDAGLRRFVSELLSRAKELNLNSTDKYYQDFMNTFVEMINEKSGLTTEYVNGKAQLTREALEKYLENNSVDDLVDLVNSKELRDTYYMKSFEINEEIGAFGQGITFDCWLLSDIVALRASEEGRRLLNEAIDSYVGEDGKTYYTVTLKGGIKEYTTCGFTVLDEPVTYTFSIDDLFNARESGKYSKGAWEVLLLELAISKHRETYQFPEGYRKIYIGPEGNGDNYLDYGQMGEFIHYLTGNRLNGISFNGDSNSSRAEKFYEYILNAFANGTITDVEDGNVGDYAIFVSLKMTNGTSHAYAVQEITSEGIWIVNPGSSEVAQFYTWEEFLAKTDITGIRLYQL